MPVVKHGDEMGQWFDPAKGPPVMPEALAAFYRDYIPVKLKLDGRLDQLAAAEAALKARNQVEVEKILNPPPGDADSDDDDPEADAFAAAAGRELGLD
jgi:hypothetical protein